MTEVLSTVPITLSDRVRPRGNCKRRFTVWRRNWRGARIRARLSPNSDRASPREPPYRASLSHGFLLKRCGPIRSYSFATAFPWGRGQTPPGIPSDTSRTEFRSTRTFHDVLSDQHRSSSLLSPVLNVYPEDRVMDINCNPFSILDDKGKGHIGTHKTLMGQVIHDNDGETLRTAMATFWFQIIQYDNSFLEDPKGLALVFWCSYGKQRSTAVAGVFRHCMERYGWGRLFGRSHTRSESKPEITLLSWKVYEADSCGIMPCPQCDDRISGRTGSDLRTAYDIWCQVSTFYKRQRSDWM